MAEPTQRLNASRHSPRFLAPPDRKTAFANGVPGNGRALQRFVKVPSPFTMTHQ